MLSEAHDNLINSTVYSLKQGDVIIYPTESIFGLGCDPFNQKAVSSLLALKHRPESQGLILIANDWSQIERFIEPISQDLYKKVMNSWPGNTTWLFKKSKLIPDWISGKYSSIAFRIPDHPIARKICELFDGPIVSTSANVSGQDPCKTLHEVYDNFTLNEIGYILPLEVGKYDSPSTIKDLYTDQIIR